MQVLPSGLKPYMSILVFTGISCLLITIISNYTMMLLYLRVTSMHLRTDSTRGLTPCITAPARPSPVLGNATPVHVLTVALCSVRALQPDYLPQVR